MPYILTIHTDLTSSHAGHGLAGCGVCWALLPIDTDGSWMGRGEFVGGGGAGAPFAMILPRTQEARAVGHCHAGLDATLSDRV